MYTFVTVPNAMKLIRMLSPNNASLFIDYSTFRSVTVIDGSQ
jgi:hypothetical protein